MEKEICILKNFRNILDATTETDCSELDKAIARIEESIKPKTCSSCKYWDFNEQGHFKRCFNGKGNVVSTEAGFGCNRYEPKDTQC